MKPVQANLVLEPHDSSVVDNEVLYIAPCSWVLSHVLRKKTEYPWEYAVFECSLLCAFKLWEEIIFSKKVIKLRYF